jgi:2-iminobutanoate/2-iminopropanoate deaminase
MKRVILSSLCALAVLPVAAFGRTLSQNKTASPAAATRATRKRAPAAVKTPAPQRPRRVVVKTERAPQAIGPYSQAIIAAGELVYASGQIGFDPKTGEMVRGGIEEQTEQTLRNLAAVLEAAGSDMSHVLKTTVFLADMNDFAAMNEVYRRHFKDSPPARSTVQVARLPRDARIEIEAVALVKKD